MANVPQELRYTEEHEYVKEAGEAGVVTVGITDYAQDQLGDVVFVELPSVGASFKRMEVFGTI
ncbi:MAG TPA: glycine cleavage system protein H, partial [Gemmatimonadales bacterium]|nr:glycine cleavage system protein H [Gemmatimonadales bacterium]